MNGITMEYNYLISNGHHILETEGQLFVVDTGSPLSLSFDSGTDCVTIGGQDFILLPAQMVMNVRKLNELIGLEVDGIIGLDVLKAMSPVTFDRASGKILIRDADGEFENSADILTRDLMGLEFTVCDILVDGQTRRVIFDTGACVGYFSGAMLKNAELVGKVHDYAPSFGGSITADSYRVRYTLGSCETVSEIAKMPVSVGAQVRILGCEGIIGLNDIPANVIRLDLDEGKLYF